MVEAAQPAERSSLAVPQGPLRVVVFTCGPLGVRAAEEISRLEGFESVTVVCAPYRSPRRKGVWKIRHAVRYEGMGGTARLALQRLAGRREAEPDPAPPHPPSVDVLEFADLHHPACLAAVRELAPDLGVVVGTYILKPDLFSIPRLGSINLHTGKAPEYRGAAPGFWEMYNGERRIGITIHRVTAELDSGAIIRQEMLPFDPAPSGDPLAYVESFRDTVLQPAGIRLLAEAVRDIALGEVQEIAQDQSAARMYRMPTSRQKRELRRRVARRRSTGWRRTTKGLLGWLLFRSGLYRLLVRNKAFVVLFHRVDDRYAGNPISCTSAEFDRYCGFFARYFDVIGASELVDLVEAGGDLTGKLVVTFDDGYADNVEAAATMRRHGITGCFFIATDYIGTERDGWWDVQQGHHSYWMTWDEVRQLDEWGFELGAHTRDHVDLGRVTGPEAVAEIDGSRLRLETELGQRIDHFAYPYGARTNIVPENVEVVRACGFRTCMSAYGGFVTHRTDPFDLHRFAVSPWHRSPWQLGLELLTEPPARR